MTTRLPLAVAIVPLSAVAAACGSHAPSKSSTGTVSPTATPSAAPAAPPSFDVTSTQVTETFLTNERLATGTFNGRVYKFTGAPAITNETVDPQSDHTVAPTGISFTANSISVNNSGLSVTNGAKQILDVTFTLP